MRFGIGAPIRATLPHSDSSVRVWRISCGCGWPLPACDERQEPLWSAPLADRQRYDSYLKRLTVEDFRFLRTRISFLVGVWRSHARSTAWLHSRSLPVVAVILATSAIVRAEAQTTVAKDASGVSGGPPKAWTLTIPAIRGLFLGKELRVDIDLTEGVIEPSDQERTLLDEILANLPLVIGNAERALAEYEKGTHRDYASHIANPHIWIPKERENEDAWTLVVERDDWPDFGWHLEFRRLDLLEIWASD
jgi:hypothetical protein